MKIIVSCVNVARSVTPDQTPNKMAMWTIAVDADGTAKWAFGTAAPDRVRVRSRRIREKSQTQFNLFAREVAEGISDPRGASHPPRSAASALREQVRKRIWNELRRTAKRAEVKAEQGEPCLFTL
jgi:hypothetical protein